MNLTLSIKMRHSSAPLHFLVRIYRFSPNGFSLYIIRPSRNRLLRTLYIVRGRKIKKCRSKKSDSNRFKAHLTIQMFKKKNRLENCVNLIKYGPLYILVPPLCAESLYTSTLQHPIFIRV